MKVLLFAPPFELSSQEESGTYPLALAYIGKVLERRKFDVKAFNYLYKNWDEIEQEVYNLLCSEKPEIIGISSMTTNRIAAFEIAKMAKRINPNIRVIMGGVHPSIMYKQILENLPVDFIVIGEGEETASELFDAIRKNKPKKLLKKIKGIAFKENDKIIITNSRPFTKNLDQIPFPKHEYFKDKIKKFKEAYIATSRGCPIGCTFCSTSCHWGKIRRQRSVKNVIEEIKYIKNKLPFIEKIHFQDDEFIMNQDWIKEFCEALKKNRINIKFECCGRVSSITEEMIKLLKEAGCTKLHFGVESGSQIIINSIKKKILIKQAINAFDICKKYMLKTGIYLMVGLPGENDASINDTIALLKRIKNANLDLPAVFQLYPGTEVYENAKKQGFIEDSYWLTNKVAPFYTLEHSKRKLFFWSLKISFWNNLYKGTLIKFILKKIRDNLQFKNIKKQFLKYIK
jgi:radical SAM superfamily enzyme YgiQ (UPF0313 family)